MYFVVYSTIFGVDISTLKSADYSIIFFFRSCACVLGWVCADPAAAARRLSRVIPRAAVGVSSAHKFA
jgi:hypothetical protein